jgi:hypothetical protein
MVRRSKGSQRVYPESERDIEKRLARQRDAERLRSGAVSPSGLAAEDPFAGLNLQAFRIVSIGGRRIGRRGPHDLTDEQFDVARARAAADLADYQPGERTSLFAGIDDGIDDEKS